MPCGLYGKLPAKRDFVAVNMPREFLLRWEEWLQGGISASRIALGHDWLKAYLQAPLWRFWLGAGICGVPVSGAIMASVDGVGRHFPLTVFECATENEALALPSDMDNVGWYERLEDFLLSTLEPGVDYDALLVKLEMMPLSSKLPASIRDSTVIESFGAMACGSADAGGLTDAFAAIQAERQRLELTRASFWWTIGGEDYAPYAIVADGMPAPHIVEAMLTRQFDRGSG